MEGMIRVRSLAIVATAVVCTLVVTHAWSAGAAPGDTDSTFVPTAGCRLADTRPAPNNVGPRDTPLGAGGMFDVAVRAANGECTDALAIPTDAVAVALNVTAVNATATSNIRLYPANLTEVPLLSNLNVTAGAPAVPNKVDVKLSPDGKIRVFNEFGSVNVILDVVGYYTDSTLQELSQRIASLEAAQTAGVDPDVLARLDALETSTADNSFGVARLDAREPFAVTSRDDSEFVTAAEVVVSVTVTAPAAGQVTVNSTTVAVETNAGDRVHCSITTGTTVEGLYLQQWESSGSSDGAISQMAGTRTFNIKGPNPRLGTDGSATYNLVCELSGSSPDATLRDSVLTAIFTPAL